MPSKRLASVQASTSQHKQTSRSPHKILLPAGLYSVNMASTRFQSGIDDASRPPGFSLPPHNRNDRFDFQRHIESRPADAAAGQWEIGSALDSFVDDRCPTIWEVPGRFHLPTLPKTKVGRPLDAPVSALAIRPVNAPRETHAGGTTTFFASAIDPGLSTASRVEDRKPELFAPQITKNLASPAEFVEVPDGATRFVSAIDPGTSLPRPPSIPPRRAPDRATQFQSAIDAGTLAPPDASLLDVPRTTGIKPLEGDLLKKLFKHAANERRRAEDAYGPRVPGTSEELPAQRETIYKQPSGFHIPDREDLRGARNEAKQREQEAARQAEVEKEAARQQAAAVPLHPRGVASEKLTRPSAPKDPSRLIRILAKSGEEAFLEMPRIPPIKAASLKSDDASRRHATEEQKRDIKPVQPQKERQKKQQGKQKEKQNQQPQAQTETQKQQDNERAKAAKLAAEALMSGALPQQSPPKSASGSAQRSAQDSAVGFEGIYGAEKSVHSQQKSVSAFQPRVDSASSRAASKKDEQPPRAGSARPASESPLQDPSIKAPSAASWAEVGEATFHAIRSRTASKHSSVKSTPKAESVAAWQKVHAVVEKPSAPASRRETSHTGWEKTDENAQRATSVRSSKQSVRSFQSLGQGWAAEQSQEHQSIHPRSGKASEAPSLKSFQSIGDGWVQPQQSRSPSHHSLHNATPWQKDDSEHSQEHHSRNASTHRDQASVHDWEEVPLANGSRSLSARQSVAASRIWPDGDELRQSVSGGHSRLGSGHSRHVSNHSHHSARIPLPAAELNNSNVEFNNPSPQLSNAWPQQDAQNIESWPAYEEPRQTSHAALSDQRRHSSKVTSRRSQLQEASLHSRQTSVGSNGGAQLSHVPPFHDEVYSERRQSHLSYHSISGNQNPPPHHQDDNESYAGSAAGKAPYAGKGWITPHPLSVASSVVEPQSRIVLPSEANPNGRTMTYDEWKEMQKRGLRLHRNISITESSKTRNGIFEDERYRHSEWQGTGWEGVNPAEDGSQISRHTGRSSNYRSPSVRSESRERSVAYSGSGWVSERHTGYAETISESRHASEHASERQWEEMEEGVAGFGIPQNDGAGSERDMMQRYIDSRPPSAARSLGSEQYYKRKHGIPPLGSLA